MIELKFTGSNILDIHAQIKAFLYDNGDAADTVAVGETSAPAPEAPEAPAPKPKKKNTKKETEAPAPAPDPAPDHGSSLTDVRAYYNPNNNPAPQNAYGDPTQPMPTFDQMREQPTVPQNQYSPNAAGFGFDQRGHKVMAPQNTYDPNAPLSQPTQQALEITNADLVEACRMVASANPSLDTQIRSLIAGFTQQTGLPPQTGNIPQNLRADFIARVKGLL